MMEQVRQTIIGLKSTDEQFDLKLLDNELDRVKCKLYLALTKVWCSIQLVSNTQCLFQRCNVFFG